MDNQEAHHRACIWWEKYCPQNVPIFPHQGKVFFWNFFFLKVTFFWAVWRNCYEKKVARAPLSLPIWWQASGAKKCNLRVKTVIWSPFWLDREFFFTSEKLFLHVFDYARTFFFTAQTAFEGLCVTFWGSGVPLDPVAGSYRNERVGLFRLARVARE